MTSKPFHPRATVAAAFAAGALLLTPAAFAQEGRQNDNRPDTSQQALSAQDRQFVNNAAQGGLMEVEAGQLASQKAQHADVKAFGARMVQDHGKANSQLEQTVGSMGMTLPKELATPHRQHMDHLARLSGAAFDREYMKQMVQDHQKTVADFEKQAERGENAAVRGFAQQNLPVLQEHLRMAQELATKVGAQTNAQGTRPQG
ncbi:MAG TPA: DUF4142 domain-containing protein [Thermoanaerobaculia bacterium]|nr:DUF4142 domain-containing protein [Thermoanaerobaculia bacterium]